MRIAVHSIWEHDTTKVLIKVIKVYSDSGMVDAVQMRSGNHILLRKEVLTSNYTNIPKKRNGAAGG